MTTQAPIRHAENARNRVKAQHHVQCLLEELEHIDKELRGLVDEHLRYAIGRVRRLSNRLKAKE